MMAIFAQKTFFEVIEEIRNITKAQINKIGKAT